MTPLMLAMGRRRAEVEAVAADAMVEGVAGEAVGLARGRMGGRSGGSLTAVTAQAAGELPAIQPHPSAR